MGQDLIQSIFDLGYDKNLIKQDSSSDLMKENITDGLDPNLLKSGNWIGNLIMSQGYLRSSNYILGVSGWNIAFDGTAQIKDITLIGGTLNYQKTSFVDATHAGYYISSQGIYFGSASDAKYLKYTIATGVLDYVGAISGRSTTTIASAINVDGHFIDGNLDTSTKSILKDFTFGSADYSGAFKTGDITWNTTTGALTGGSGGLFNKNGLLFAHNGVATITLDGITGAATFSGNVIGATITGGIIQTATSGARVLMSNANDITFYDDTTGGVGYVASPYQPGTITGNSAKLGFFRTDDVNQGFIFQKRAGKDFDLDNIFEFYPVNSGFGRLNYCFFGRDGTGVSNVNNNYFGVTVACDSARPISAGNGRVAIEITRDGDVTTQSPAYLGMDASQIYGSMAAVGVWSLIVGSGANGGCGIGYDVSPGVINVGAGMFDGNPTTVRGDTDNLFDIGSSTIRYKTGYFYNLDVVNGNVKSFECGENITSKDIVGLGRYTSGEFRANRFNETSYVDLANPNTNYGTETVLKIKTSGAGQQEAYLKFSTGESGDPELFDKVYLRIYFTAVSATFKLSIERVTSNWSEDTITWNNKPTIDTSRYWGWTIDTPLAAGYLDIDITEIYCMCFAGPETNYGIRIFSSGSSGEGDTVTISSSRAGVQGPALVFYGLYDIDKIWKIDNSNNLNYYAWTGFAEETKTTGQQCKVNIGEYLTTSGLTIGKDYYIDSTSGLITPDFSGTGANNFKIGTAISTTLLKIDKTKKFNILNTVRIGSGDNFASTTITNNRYDVIIFGIPPISSKMRSILLNYNVAMFEGESKIKRSDIESGIMWSVVPSGGTLGMKKTTNYTFDFSGISGATDMKIDTVTIWNNFIIIKSIVSSLAAGSSMLLSTEVTN